MNNSPNCGQNVRQERSMSQNKIYHHVFTFPISSSNFVTQPFSLVVMLTSADQFHTEATYLPQRNHVNNFHGKHKRSHHMLSYFLPPTFQRRFIYWPAFTKLDFSFQVTPKGGCLYVFTTGVEFNLAESSVGIAVTKTAIITNVSAAMKVSKEVAGWDYWSYPFLSFHRS